MDLMEYEAKALFELAGLPVVRRAVFDGATPPDAPYRYPVVVKAQVPTGGRGKLGGIKFAADREELDRVCREIHGMKIKEFTVERLMVCERVEVTRELYLSVMLDRNSKRHVMIFSPDGGMDIEQTAREHPERIYRIPIDPLLGYSTSDGLYLAGRAGLDREMSKKFAALLGDLYRMCRDYDCMLAEINPLVIDDAGGLIALDAKVSVDDSAVARHAPLAAMKAEHKLSPLAEEAASYNFLYIPCDPAGDVVVISNGSGMLMSCIDHITRNGRTVSAVLDLGGGATAERIAEAVRILFSTPGAKVLFINIFGGITRCDEVAGGIRAALEKHRITRPVIVRFEGTNKEKGLEILRELEGVTYVDGLIDGVEAIVRCGA